MTTEAPPTTQPSVMPAPVFDPLSNADGTAAPLPQPRFDPLSNISDSEEHFEEVGPPAPWEGESVSATQEGGANTTSPFPLEPPRSKTPPRTPSMPLTTTERSEQSSFRRAQRLAKQMEAANQKRVLKIGDTIADTKVAEAALMRAFDRQQQGLPPEKIGFWEYLREMTEFKKTIPIIGDGFDVWDITQVYDAAMAVNNDNATIEQELLIKNYNARQAEREIRGLGAGGVAAMVLSQIPKYAGALALTGFAAKAGKALTVKAIEAGLKRAAIKVAEKSAARTALKATEGVLGHVVGAAFQTPVAMSGQITAETFQRMLPHFDVRAASADDLTMLDWYVTQQGDDFIPALQKAGLHQYIGVLTEGFGGPAQKGVTHAFNKIPLSVRTQALKLFVFNKYLQRVKATNISVGLNKLAVKGQWNSFFEIGEEEADKALTYLTGIEDDYKLTTSEELWGQIIAFGGMKVAGGLMGVGEVQFNLPPSPLTQDIMLYGITGMKPGDPPGGQTVYASDPPDPKTPPPTNDETNAAIDKTVAEFQPPPATDADVTAPSGVIENPHISMTLADTFVEAVVPKLEAIESTEVWPLLNQVNIDIATLLLDDTIDPAAIAANLAQFVDEYGYVQLSDNDKQLLTELQAFVAQMPDGQAKGYVNATLNGMIVGDPMIALDVLNPKVEAPPEIVEPAPITPTITDDATGVVAVEELSQAGRVAQPFAEAIAKGEITIDEAVEVLVSKLGMKKKEAVKALHEVVTAMTTAKPKAKPTPPRQNPPVETPAAAPAVESPSPTQIRKQFAAAGSGHTRLLGQLDARVDDKSLSPEARDLFMLTVMDTADAFLGKVQLQSKALGLHSTGESLVSLYTIRLNKRLSEKNLDPNNSFSSPRMSDFVTLTHEFLHLTVEHVLTREEITSALQVYKSRTPAQWFDYQMEGLTPNEVDQVIVGVNVEKAIAKYESKNWEEWLVQTAVEYAMTGRLPEPALEPLLKRLGRTFRDAFNRLRGRPVIKDMVPIFEAMFGGVERPEGMSGGSAAWDNIAAEMGIPPTSGQPRSSPGTRQPRQQTVDAGGPTAPTTVSGLPDTTGGQVSGESVGDPGRSLPPLPWASSPPRDNPETRQNTLQPDFQERYPAPPFLSSMVQRTGRILLAPFSTIAGGLKAISDAESLFLADKLEDAAPIDGFGKKFATTVNSVAMVTNRLRGHARQFRNELYTAINKHLPSAYQLSGLIWRGYSKNENRKGWGWAEAESTAAVEAKVDGPMPNWWAEIIVAYRSFIDEMGRILERANIKQKVGDGLWRQFQKHPGGRVWPRLLTQQGYDILRHSPTSDEFNLLVEALASMNNLSENFVRARLRNIRELVVGDTSKMQHVGAEFTRFFPKVPTHLRLKGTIVPVFETRLEHYAEKLLSSVAHRTAVVMVIGQSPGAINDLREQFIKSGGTASVFDATIRALHDMPPFQTESTNPATLPSSSAYTAVSHLGGLLRNVEALALSASAPIQAFEPLGMTAPMLGFANTIRGIWDALPGVGSRKTALELIEKLGLATHDQMVWSVDRGNYVDWVLSKSSDMITRGTLVKFMNQFQDEAAAFAVIRALVETREGRGTRTIREFAETLGFTNEEAKLIQSGKMSPHMAIDFAYKAMAVISGQVQQRVLTSRLRNTRLWGRIFPFSGYFSRNARYVRLSVDNFVAAVNKKDEHGNHTPDWGRALRQADAFTRYTFAKTGAGFGTMLLMSAFNEGLVDGPERKIRKWSLDPNEMMKAAGSAVATGAIGGMWASVLNLSAADNADELVDQATRGVFHANLFLDTLNAYNGDGPYKNMSPGERISTFARNRSPLLKKLPVKALLVQMSMVDFDPVSDQAKRSYYEFIRENDIGEEPDEFDEQFHIRMRQAFDAMLLGNSEEATTALNLAFMVRGKTKNQQAKSVASYMRSRKYMTGFTDAEKNHLLRVIGPELYHRLVRDNETLDLLSEAILEGTQEPESPESLMLP